MIRKLVDNLAIYCRQRADNGISEDDRADWLDAAHLLEELSVKLGV